MPHIFFLVSKRAPPGWNGRVVRRRVCPVWGKGFVYSINFSPGSFRRIANLDRDRSPKIDVERSHARGSVVDQGKGTENGTRLPN